MKTISLDRPLTPDPDNHDISRDAVRSRRRFLTVRGRRDRIRSDRARYAR